MNEYTCDYRYPGNVPCENAPAGFIRWERCPGSMGFLHACLEHWSLFDGYVDQPRLLSTHPDYAKLAKAA